MKTDFLKMLFGTTTAKVFGLLRELLFFIFLANAIEYSQILSLLAISSLFVFVSDTAFLNPILFPQWEKQKNLKVNFNLFHIVLALIISSFFYFFNEITIQSNQTNLVKLICAFLWVPLVFHGIGYSNLVFRKKLYSYSTLLTIISFAYTLSFWFLKDLGAEGYLFSRLLSIILGFLIVIYFMRTEIKLTSDFKFIKFLEFKQIAIKFFNVNNVIFTVFIIRLIYSQFLIENLAVLNYSMVISFIFQNLVNKNLNALAILERNLNQKKSKKLQKQYFLIFTFFIFLALLSSTFFSKYFLVDQNYIDLFDNVLYHTLFLFPVLFFCGRQDLINSEKILLENKSFYNKSNFKVIFFTTIAFFSLLLLKSIIIF